MLTVINVVRALDKLEEGGGDGNRRKDWDLDQKALRRG